MMNLSLLNDILFSSKDSREEINIFNFSDDERKKYYILYYFYLIMFMKYMDRYTLLKKIDKEIEESNLNFEKIIDSEKDFYQLLVNEYNYLYVRNNFYIYRLSDDEKCFMISRLKNNNYELDLEMEEFIKKTFKKVIYEKIEDVDYTVNVNFALNEGVCFAPNDALVLGMRYDYKKSNLNDDEWYENYLKQEDFLEVKLELLRKNIKDVLNIECYIFQYEEFSIKKLIIN